MRRILVMVVVLFSGFAARAGGLIDEARTLYNDMEYLRAVATAGKVLTQPSSQPDEVLEAYLLIGLGLAVEGRSKQARDAFLKLLVLQPDYELAANVSPKLASVFYTAKAMAKRTRPLGLEHEKEMAGKDLLLRVRLLANPLGLAQAVRVKYGTGEQARWTSEKRSWDKGGEVGFLLKGRADQPLGYLFELLNEHGAVLKRLPGGGECYRHEPPAPPPALAVEKPLVKKMVPEAEELATASVPVRAVEEREKAPAWYGSWWFWTAVGVVVAGGATVGAVLGSQGAGGGTREYGVVFK